jgi:hypothetical protein
MFVLHFTDYSQIKQEEREAWKKITDEDEQYNSNRGLLFVCYQSSIDNGFFRQTVQYGNNNYFPITSINPTKHSELCTLLLQFLRVLKEHL